MPVILAMWETEIRRIVVQGQSEAIFKITTAKWPNGVGQVVKCLLCKTPSSEFKPQAHWKKGF
jgi:hypothetical protein